MTALGPVTSLRAVKGRCARGAAAGVSLNNVTYASIVDFKDIKSIVDLMKKNSLSEFEMEKE